MGISFFVAVAAEEQAVLSQEPKRLPGHTSVAVRFFGAGLPFGAFFFLLAFCGLTSPGSNTSSGRSVLREPISEPAKWLEGAFSGKHTLGGGGYSGC